MAQTKNNTPAPGVPSSPVSEIDALKQIQELFKTSEQKRVADLLLSKGAEKRPTTWSGMTVASYYKERFALELKAVVDEMMKAYAAADLTDVEWSFKDYPEMAPSTIYNKLNQSKRYLLEKMDIQGIYSAFFQLVNFTRERTGIRLSYARDIRNPNENTFKPKKVISKYDGPTWKIKIQKWLDNAKEKERLHVKNLSLTPEEIDVANELLSNIHDILFEVTDEDIRIVKLTKEDVERLK